MDYEYIYREYKFLVLEKLKELNRNTNNLADLGALVNNRGIKYIANGGSIIEDGYKGYQAPEQLLYYTLPNINDTVIIVNNTAYCTIKDYLKSIENVVIVFTYITRITKDEYLFISYHNYVQRQLEIPYLYPQERTFVYNMKERKKTNLTGVVKNFDDINKINNKLVKKLVDKFRKNNSLIDHSELKKKEEKK